jgi:enoyl-CoA hydratase
MQQFNTISWEQRDQIAFVTLNRPKMMNALSTEAVEELLALFAELKKDRTVLGVVITGAGRAFCAGADLSGGGEAEGSPYFRTREFVLQAQELMNQIEAFPHPVIAAVNGFALGGGCELALACDLRIASTEAVFGLPETTLGVIPCFGGTQRLPRLIGTAPAKEMIYTGRKVKADEAKSLGIVNEVVAPENLMEAAEAKMAQITANAPLALRMAKTVINQGVELPLHLALEMEADMTALLGTTDDAAEGGRAFHERRKPNFKNQ